MKTSLQIRYLHCFKKLQQTSFTLRTKFCLCLDFWFWGFSKLFVKSFLKGFVGSPQLRFFYLFLQPLYTDIPDPAYMSLHVTKSDNNRMYTELNSPQANSTTTERRQEPGYYNPKAAATTVKYQNCMEMKTYVNM